MAGGYTGQEIRPTDIILNEIRFNSGPLCIQAERFVDMRRTDRVDDIPVHVHQFIVTSGALCPVDIFVCLIGIALKNAVPDLVYAVPKIRRFRRLFP